MKLVLLALYFIPYLCFSQLSTDEGQILNLELLTKQKDNNNRPYLKTILGDSILLSKIAGRYEKTPAELKSWCVMAKQLSQTDANEIFGSDDKTLFTAPPKNIEEWTTDYFADFTILFYDGKNPKKYYLKMYNILVLSMPLLRNDGKYALIYTSSESEGGVLNIYKKADGVWYLYKTVQLYFI